MNNVRYSNKIKIKKNVNDRIVEKLFQTCCFAMAINYAKKNIFKIVSTFQNVELKTLKIFKWTTQCINKYNILIFYVAITHKIPSFVRPRYDIL